MAITVEGRRAGQLILNFGAVYQSADNGRYRFIPFVEGRRSSRRAWLTIEASIPAWVRKIARQRDMQVVLGERAA